MKITVRTLFLSIAAGVVLSALAVFGGIAEACTGQQGPPPGPPNPCSKPADDCALPSEVGTWTPWCCKDVGGGSSCYWVGIRPICCGTWKWGYQDGTELGMSCDNLTHHCF
jgi:hypothetical protein